MVMKCIFGCLDLFRLSVLLEDSSLGFLSCLFFLSCLLCQSIALVRPTAKRIQSTKQFIHTP